MMENTETATVSYLTDSLTGILKGDTDMDQAREERLKEKYEVVDCREHHS